MHQQPPPHPRHLSPQQAAAQDRYQEVAKKLHAMAKRRFPNRQISQIKFVQVDTPPNVTPGQLVNLTGAIDGQDLQIVIPAGARVGRQFEVPYIRFDDSSGPGGTGVGAGTGTDAGVSERVGGDNDIVVGDPFFVFPPVLSPREADEDVARQLLRAWQEEHPAAAPDPAVFKARGNDAFKAKAYRDAARLYGAAVLACLHRVRTEAPLRAAEEGDEERRQAQLAEQKRLAQRLEMHVAYTNLALALLKLRSKPARVQEALEACENALNIEPAYTKALFRAGQSLQELGRVQDAVAAYSRASELKPDDAAVQKALKKCKAQLQALHQQGAQPAGGPALPPPSGSSAATAAPSAAAPGITAAADAGGHPPPPPLADHEHGKKRNPLGSLYSDKPVERKYDWGPIPTNGEYNEGWLTSGGGKAANEALMARLRAHGVAGIAGGGGAAPTPGQHEAGGSGGSAASKMVEQLEQADRDAKWVDIVEYHFEDFMDKVVVTVDGVRGAGDLPRGRITCQLDESAMVLKIRGVHYDKLDRPAATAAAGGGSKTAGGAGASELVNLRMVCGELWGKIVREQSGVTARGDEVVVTLRKNVAVSDRPWERLEYGKGGSWGAFGS